MGRTQRRYKVVVLGVEPGTPAAARAQRPAPRRVGLLGRLWRAWRAWSWKLQLASGCFLLGCAILLHTFTR